MLSPLEQIQAYRSLCQSLSLATTLKEALGLMTRNAPVDGVFSNIYLPERKELQVLAHVDETGAVDRQDRIPVPEATTRLKITHSEAVYIINRPEDDPFTNVMGRKIAPEMKSWLIMKASLESKHWGVVIFCSKKEQAFSEEALHLIEELRPVLSLSVGFVVNERLANLMTDLTEENRKLEHALAQQYEAPLETLIETTPSMKRLEEAIRM